MDDAVATVVDEPASRTAAGPITWQQEMHAIARRHAVSFAELQSPSRKRALVAARWEAWAALRARRWSLPKIGALFARDHTTVMYGLRERARREAEKD
jgi:chromosomal replication initiation ATPase DnaA